MLRPEHKDVIRVTFLNNLEMLMIKKNINRSELARGLGMSTSAVNSWWNRSCENISLQTLIKISNYFDITLEELVNGTASEVFIFDTNEFKTYELYAIYNFAQFLKDNRGDLAKVFTLPDSERYKK